PIARASADRGRETPASDPCQIPSPICEQHSRERRCLETPGPRHAYAALTHQADRLDFELSTKLAPLHRSPPASQNTLSRCPRNRQQATSLISAFRQTS